MSKMMNNLLTVRIQEHMEHFSKGQRLIAKYIEEHYDKAGGDRRGQQVHSGTFCN